MNVIRTSRPEEDLARMTKEPRTNLGIITQNRNEVMNYIAHCMQVVSFVTGLGHRIANFPNYVTITSSLTHHRIVNLGPQRFGPPPPS